MPKTIRFCRSARSPEIRLGRDDDSASVAVTPLPLYLREQSLWQHLDERLHRWIPPTQVLNEAHGDGVLDVLVTIAEPPLQH